MLRYPASITMIVFIYFWCLALPTWCVCVTLPKDHLSIKQYAEGTVGYYGSSLLGFPVDQVFYLYHTHLKYKVYQIMFPIRVWIFLGKELQDSLSME